MDNEKLSLNKYLQLCLAFLDDPTVDNESAINVFLGNLIIKDYMPMKDKMVCSAKIMLELDKDFDAIGAAAMLEVNKILYGLCAYATNLENDIGDLNKTYVAYDLCQQFGLAKAILKVCATDYNKLDKQIDSMIDIANVYKLLETAALFNQADYNKLIITMNELKDSLTPDLLKDLEAFNLMNNNPIPDVAGVIAERLVQASETARIEENMKVDRIVDNFESAGYGNDN